ncbi:MAG TPA: NlpC/P60 family protein [Pyrinomonadaceae bacterium]|nr:NlpC/P60 family protein [Pyrinomonadaceae bacterium]
MLFPRLLVVVAALVFSGSAIAQSSEADPRPTTTSINRLESEPVAAPVEEGRPRVVSQSVPAKSANKPAALVPTISLTNRFDQSLLAAIQSHLGASYHFNRTGPEEFDCSGLVWRAFQDIGVDFQRGPARSYWATMPAPAEAEQFKFGTLVFFSNLSHIGIVVDEKGFYHSARHGGVMYSPFNDYWLSRIDGFRRVPVASLQTPTANAKPRKQVNTAALVDDDNQP